MLFNIIPEELILKTNESELVVYLRNGSILQLKGADNPDTLRGSNTCGVILDEFAMMKFDAWGIIEPILRANNGWCWFIGTPKGKNHLYRLYLKGQQGHSEWHSWLLKASQSGIIAPDQLDESRKSMSQALYNQEWECEFLEGEGAVFRGVRDILTAIPKKPETNHLYVCGVDLAKYQDYTVITVYDRRTNEQVYQDRFQTIEWPFQKKRIKAISEHYNRALVVLDATGIGDPVADDLMRYNVPVEPYRITEPSKKEMIEKLSIWIEQKKIKMLPIQETIDEFENFAYVFSKDALGNSTGRAIYGAPEGFNDDIVIAHALAIWSLQPLSEQILVRPKTLVQKHYEQKKQEHWDNILNESNREWAEWEVTDSV